MFLRRLRPRVAIFVLTAAIMFAGCSYFGNPRPEIRELTIVTTFSSDDRIREPFGIAIRDGEIYVSDGEAGAILKLASDGTAQLFATGLNTPSSIAFLPDGDLIVADTGSHTIKRVGTDGTVRLLAGVESVAGSEDGPAASATFNGPIGIAVDPNGGVYVADTYNDRIRFIDSHGVVSTAAGSSRGFGDGLNSVARFDTPLGIAFWNDNLLIADSGNRRIRVLDPRSDVWTLTGTGDADQRDSTLASASFVSPTAVSVGAGGEIFVADGNAIRVIGRRALPFVDTLAGDRRGYADEIAIRSSFNRPSGIAIGPGGELLIADSDNRVVRAISDGTVGRTISRDQIDSRRMQAEEFRTLQPARWPYDPPSAVREIAGTLGEIRGEVGNSRSSWFHNGLDIAGGYGEVARFLRTEVALDPHSAQHFGTARELLRLPTIGYIHLRLGRDSQNNSFEDRRFLFDRDAAGKPTDVRVPRGARFNAGEMLGTLNSQNHVHLIAGRSGSEMNALDALGLPGVSDGIGPTIENLTLYDQNWSEIETGSSQTRIKQGDKFRVIVRAYDRMDGNAERRRLGVYRVGYELDPDSTAGQIQWKIVFDRTPPNDAVRFVYAPGSRSGATGGTIFNYIATNRVSGDSFAEEFIDTQSLAEGKHVVRVHVADFFGNTASRDITFEVFR